MTQDFYTQALFTARVELSDLLKERETLDARRAEIEQRVAQLDQTIKGLSILSGEKPEATVLELHDQVAGLGLADACRATLRVRDRYVTPIGVRDSLQTVGYDLSGQTNPLASIHAILKRFVESGEAESLEVEGKVGYRLKANPTNKRAKMFYGGGSLLTESTPSEGDIVLANPPYKNNLKPEVVEALRAARKRRQATAGFKLQPRDKKDKK